MRSPKNQGMPIVPKKCTACGVKMQDLILGKAVHHYTCPASPVKCKLCIDDHWVTDATPCPRCNADGSKQVPGSEDE